MFPFFTPWKHQKTRLVSIKIKFTKISKYYISKKKSFFNLSPVPIPDEEKKLTEISISIYFVKPFEVPQRSVKIKIQVNFYFNTISEMYGEGKG